MNEPTVRLMHYDPRWRQEFEQTKSSILSSCEGTVTAVEHIGSTAISGLIARPTIDVIAGVETFAVIETAAFLIEGLNFRRGSPPEWFKNGVVLRKPRHLHDSAPEPTHCVYLTVRQSTEWTRATRLRDHLRDNPPTAIQFETAKVRRWRSGLGDLVQYESDKAIFLSHLLDQIQFA